MANQQVVDEGDSIKKIYDIKNPEESAFTCMTQAEKFANEVKIYRMLVDTNITPKLLEVGNDFLRIEKWEWSLEDALKSGKWNKKEIKKIMEIHVKPLCEKLDKMRIYHGDACLSNIVCDHNLTKFAIIDFESSDILGKFEEKPQNFIEFVDF